MRFSKYFKLKNPSKRTIDRSNNISRFEWIKKYGTDITITIVFAIFLTLLFPAGKSFQFTDLKEGRVYVGSEIIAPFTFPVNKNNEEYAADIKEAKSQVAPVFTNNPEIELAEKQKLNNFIGTIKSLLSSQDTYYSDVQNVVKNEGIIISDDDLINLFVAGEAKSAYQPNGGVTSEIVKKRLEIFSVIVHAIEELVKEFYSTGILDQPRDKVDPGSKKVSVRKNNHELLEDLNYYFDPQDVNDKFLEKLRNNYKIDDWKIKIAYQFGVHFIVPNIIFDDQETLNRVEDAIANVPLAKDQVLAGERIIDSHERITKYHIERLNSLAVAKAEQGDTQGFWGWFLPYLGKFLYVLFILSIFIIFLWRSNRALLENRKQLLLIVLTIAIVAIITFLLNQFSLSSFLIPVTLGAIIITIFFDSFIGILVTLVISLLVGAIRGNEYAITFISLFASSVAILTVSRVRTRNWVLRAIAAIAVAYTLAIMVNGLVNYQPFREILGDVGYGLINGFLAPIFAYGLVIIFEFVFEMTTDMTLLELSDLNQPLLRQLALQAPGTYHHSILVGNLAEAATEAVGGNALLARVGSYYHDIGKMEKPGYFVENQTKGRNPQEKLTPSMSSMILLNHVRKGVDMAKQNSLPNEIIAFINQHHGTGLIKYFYQKALEQSSEDSVSENNFRYPGPRPQTIETAIVMLADGIEAASRTMKNPPPNRIKGMVEQFIDERFKSGELDESPLTLKDLSKISEAFQKILIGIFHGRIEYPDPVDKNNKKGVTFNKE